jgi:hypothetical protein
MVSVGIRGEGEHSGDMRKTKVEKIDYDFIKIPEDLSAEIDRIVGTHGYRSRSEVVKDAVRRLLSDYGIPQRPHMEHFNVNENGVQILDHDIEPPRGRLIMVYFTPEKIVCEYDNSSDCRHVKFALSLPEVEDILSKKGWKIPGVKLP